MLHVSAQIAIPDEELTFTFSRSGGPGGQNVNKVSSRATLRWNFADSRALPDDVRQRFTTRFGNRITVDGDVVIHSQRFRDQNRNCDDCRAKLAEMILQVATTPRKRKKTKPTRGAHQRRLKEKKQRSERKKLRQRPASGD